jgi:hypothetical protein
MNEEKNNSLNVTDLGLDSELSRLKIKGISEQRAGEGRTERFFRYW